MIYIIFLLINIGYNSTNDVSSDIGKIESTLNAYMDGTAFGQPDRLRQIFHENFNLYLVADDTLRVINGKEYINRVQKGVHYNRKARILSIDVENNTAIAKVEVFFPDNHNRATDYLLLLKNDKNWKIVQKIINLKNFSDIQELQVNNPDELSNIRNTLYDYLNGTASSNINLLDRVFYDELNLYHVAEGKINLIPKSEYIEYFKDGKQHNRIGKILSVDFEGNAASAKLQILMPESNRIAIDYLVLLKIEQKWTIIHKSFTSKSYW